MSLADITFDRAGDWIVLAEFGDGEIISIKTSVAFNVPERILGIAIITTTLANTEGVCAIINVGNTIFSFFHYLII